MLAGRLGLETARIPHIDRHGLIWLDRGQLYVEDGCLRFRTAGSTGLAAGDYGLPFQTISMVLMGPGSTVSHDAFRLMARHGTACVAVGADGVRLYTAPPFGAHDSALARSQARAWADLQARALVVRRLYAWRLGELLPHADIAVLRGIEGARMKEMYRRLAQRFGIEWKGRRYDRHDPEASDAPNQAINHVATAVESAASIAVAATAAIPQLGFIHEDSSNAFTLDVADLFRDSVTIPTAFRAVREAGNRPEIPLERHARRLAGEVFQKEGTINSMIERIKALFVVESNKSDKVSSGS